MGDAKNCTATVTPVGFTTATTIGANMATAITGMTGQIVGANMGTAIKMAAVCG